VRRDINHVVAYGQSLSSGWEGWPALSLAPRGDSLMLGQSVRPLDEAAPRWRPFGGPVFQPLAATNQDPVSGALLPPAAVAVAPRESTILGETILEAAVRYWRARQLESFPGSSHRLLASSCGVGGRSIESLSRGAQPPLFERLRECVALARTTAASVGLSYGLVATLFLQGEQNNRALGGATDDPNLYAELLVQLQRDITTEIARTTAGQTRAPAMFIHQTGGDYATADNPVPNAQLAVALRHPTIFMAAPSYPVSAKGGHLDANGYRWLGSQFGKVMQRVVTEGQNWMPLHPTHMELRGATVDIEFHVPVPPLRWDRPFVGQARLEIPDKGFAARDSSGAIPIADVAIIGPAGVRLMLARVPAGPVVVSYAAGGPQRGRGCLCDSDEAPADDRYEYSDATGHFREAFHPGLVGLPYPLANWCVAFNMQAVPSSA
jgi:hypothetical protein